MEKDFSKVIGEYNEELDTLPSLPTIEFTEDDWTTVYEGACIERGIYGYKVRGFGYGIFWIPFCNVRLKN